jgi:hypothetical protein
MAKLDLMLKDDAALPIALWMNIPHDDKTKARRAAVITYLKDKGIAAEQIQFADGPNHQTDFPAAKGIADLAKTDTDSSAGGGSSDSSSASSSAATPGGSGSH